MLLPLKTLVLASLSAAFVSGEPDDTSSPSKTVLQQLTYLKAQDGVEPEAVAAFVQEHWYAMDEKGVAAGIFTEYALWRCAPDSPRCDYVMIVGYPQARGYDDEETQRVFMDIRRAHEEANPEARTLREVMQIVGSETLTTIDP